jgi:HD superfamily phosphodiesterase
MEQTKIEKYLEDILKKKLGEGEGKDFYTDYHHARNYLMQDVLPYIKAIEPNLTDHGEKHIKNVLDNAWRLLDKDINKLTCHDLYILCLSILFHDVGNINGREDHNKKVLDVYNEIRKNNTKFNLEKHLILKSVKAHCGKTDSGSLDTLKEIEEREFLLGEPVQLREISSILRFADELAEGPQRTSDYLFKTNKISEHSKIYHKYAQITNISIDRGNQRIVLKYLININNETQASLKELLTFAYERVLKLDEERKYTKFYSNLLIPFKKTEFTFNFTKDMNEPSEVQICGVLLDYDMSNKKKLKANNLIEKFEELEIESIMGKLDIGG